jgi:predicted RNase H-like HicB family nuclease
LQGCIATSSGKEEVEKNIKEAIIFHLEGMNSECLEVPRPRSFSTNSEVSA